MLAFAPDKWGELEYVQVGFDFVGKNTLDLMLTEHSALRKIATMLQTIVLKPLQHLPLQMRIAVHWRVLQKKVLDPDGKSNGDSCDWSKECKSGRCDRRTSSSTALDKIFKFKKKIADPVVAKITIACLEILRLVAVPMITARFV